MSEISEIARVELSAITGVDLERERLEEILSSLSGRGPVLIVFNERLEVGRQINSALGKASEEEKYEAFNKLLDLIFKGPSGEKYLIRSCYLHFMMTITPGGSDLLSLGVKDLYLVVIWTKIPKISQICDPHFRGEFEANGLFYILGSQTAIGKYIQTIRERFGLGFAFNQFGTEAALPN